MSNVHRRAEQLQPTDQYKQAVYGLRCGDRSFAEDLIRKQIGRTRSVREAFDIAARLGILNSEGMTLTGFTQTQLAFDLEETEKPGNNGHQVDPGEARLDYVKDRLDRAGHSGLAIWTLVSEIGKHESASYRELEWREPVAAELNEYADLQEIVRIDQPDPGGGKPVTRFYLREYAPQS